MAADAQNCLKGKLMKKPNYGFEKFKKEQKRAKKNEEKRLRRMNKGNAQPDTNTETPPTTPRI